MRAASAAAATTGAFAGLCAVLPDEPLAERERGHAGDDEDGAGDPRLRDLLAAEQRGAGVAITTLVSRKAATGAASARSSAASTSR